MALYNRLSCRKDIIMMSRPNVEKLYTLCERESYQILRRAESLKGKKIALFPAGPTAQSFYYTLLNDYGVEAEFFIDNDPALEGKIVCGKPVRMKPWELDPNFNDEYGIYIPTAARYYMQIAAQLEELGVTRIIHAHAFSAGHLWERYKQIFENLDDEQSKQAYLGAIYSLLTGDNSYIQCENEQYFAHRKFESSLNEIVVDAGAYIGDTVEEYIKHGQGKVIIYAFEPYAEVLEKLEVRTKVLKSQWQLDDDCIVIIPAGVGAETKMLRFSKGNIVALTPDGLGDRELQVYSLDDYFKDKEPFSLLKSDIEGGEMDMLIGAETMIKKHKPKMALSIYHSPEDFAEIPEYVKLIVPEYNMAVRNHSNDYGDTILYCWCDESTGENEDIQ